MNFIPLIFYSSAFFMLMVYIVIIHRAVNGIRKNKQNKLNFDKSINKLHLDIIIPFHNEENNLHLLIHDLSNQIFKNFRIIWVNDHSTDKSTQIIERQGLANKSIVINSPERGKKNAISAALKKTNAPLILFTDADCRLPNTWTETYAKLHKLNKSGLYFGAVIHSTQNKKQKLFALEFLSLVGTGLGLGLQRNPVFMNGANYAISSDLKHLFLTKSGDKFGTGDDVFLLHAVKKHEGKNKIIPYAGSKLIVYTPAPISFKKFFRQRTRWGSKAKGYKDIESFLLAVLVFLIAIIQVFIIVYPQLTLFAILFWLIKITIDSYSLLYYTAAWEQKKLRKFIIPTSLFYPFYIVWVAIFGIFFGNKKW